MHSVVRTTKLSLIASTILLLSACDWVDSTGAHGEPIPAIDIGTSRLLNAQPLALQEESPLTATLVGEGAQLQNWTWSPETTATGASCEGIPGFDSQLAAKTLSDACANRKDCTIAFNEIIRENTTQFTIRLPRLQSPVALSYTLSTTTEEGELLTRQQPLCGISINEAPFANDDNYIALRDERRLVAANDPDSLLANDTDDIDIRNQALQIDPTPVQMPRHATEFSLGSDGSFIYQASADAPLSEAGYIDDSFVYSISDGLHTVEATAIIKIVDDNSRPRRSQRIPDLEVTITNNVDSGAQQLFDLSSYFIDPDGDPLRFSIREDLLPESGNISINTSGLLIAQPGLEDLGQWRLTVIATDGLRSRSDVFYLEVLSPEQDNLPPTVVDIRNQNVQNTFSYDISVFLATRMMTL
jgi:hypothetical protein